ncbi:MAG: nucleotidyltransferase domain-containing protein [Bacteroidota bacterium]
METQETLIYKIKETVKNVNASATVIMYGSHARGDSKETSDWDILILTSEPVNFKIEEKYSYPLYELEWETGNVISVLVKSKAEWESPKYKVTSLYQNIQKEGILL